MTERRWDAVSGEWRVVAADRQDRTYLPSPGRCPLCPTRGDWITEVPWSSFDVAVFDNRFPSLVSDPPPPSVGGTALSPVATAAGACEVVVYSADHEASLASLGPERIRLLVDVWADRYDTLGRRPEVAYVFIFENRGEAVGVTLSHPHGQVYGYPDIPPLPARELAAARHHLARHGACVLCEVVGREWGAGVRVVAANDSFVAFVPFAARLPYEVHLVARRHCPSLADLGDADRDGLAAVLHHVTVRYDALFGFALPYVMGIHQAPTADGDWHDVSHLHVELTPLHRSATRLKFLAGSELAAGVFLNDVTPEHAAAALRGAAPPVAGGEVVAGGPAPGG